MPLHRKAHAPPPQARSECLRLASQLAATDGAHIKLEAVVSELKAQLDGAGERSRQLQRDLMAAEDRAAVAAAEADALKAERAASLGAAAAAGSLEQALAAQREALSCSEAKAARAEAEASKLASQLAAMVRACTRTLWMSRITLTLGGWVRVLFVGVGVR
jgi:chromosome segregation ATPase